MLQFTLKQVREACGYSVKEVADHCSISEGRYEEYEKDVNKVPSGVMHTIRSLLKISLDSIV